MKDPFLSEAKAMGGEEKKEREKVMTGEIGVPPHPSPPSLSHLRNEKIRPGMYKTSLYPGFCYRDCGGLGNHYLERHCLPIYKMRLEMAPS